MVPKRPLDSFGVGFYYISISNPKFTGSSGTRTFLRDEYGVEAYYDIAVAPWARLTPDIQVVRPAQKRSLFLNTAGPAVISNSDIGTATVLGLRLRLVL